ncbi:MAG: HAMP domain-containing sensor histidine kinase [Peptococcaceae bacterium]|nr:HAMP domain-containing sensor histidine kinase [Peptococcaceae bacterium]
MFKQSKRKIVAAIMAVLALLFIATLAVIYTSSYAEVAASNRDMLARYAELFSLDRQPGDEPMIESETLNGPPEMTHSEKNAAFHLATFYSVAISDDGAVLAMDNDDGSVYDDAALQGYAETILASGKQQGEMAHLLYTTADKEGYTLVAFMDNTLMQQSMTTLFRNTIMFGGLMMVVLFFVAVYLAGKIVKPLEDSDRRQKQFISDAGHELKTPVSVIGANAELLAREIGADNPWLSNICYENEKMGQLVAQLLALARAENRPAAMKRLNFSRLVQGEALPFESVAFEKGLVLNCRIQEDLFINGEEGSLKQLVSIIVDNAIDHAQGEQEVVLTLQAAHNLAQLTVINGGAPIPEAQCTRLFERFYRLDAARHETGAHYGLGLAIAKAIVVAHKGQIQLQCRDGKVICTVQLPLAKS